MTIKITEKALDELRKLDVGGNHVLRINVVPGGCSGMTYSAAVDDQVSDNDEILFDQDNVKVVAESGNEVFLEGLEIDYSDDLIRAGFRFKNPNAAGSCGCGSSFSG